MFFICNHNLIIEMPYKPLPLYLPYKPYEYLVAERRGIITLPNGKRKFGYKYEYLPVENMDYLIKNPRHSHYKWVSNQSRIANRRSYYDTYGHGTAKQVAEVNFRYKMAEKRDRALRSWISKWRAKRPVRPKRKTPLNKKRSVD